MTARWRITSWRLITGRRNRRHLEITVQDKHPTNVADQLAAGRTEGGAS